MKTIHTSIGMMLATLVGCGGHDMPPGAGMSETTGGCYVGCTAADAGSDHMDTPDSDAGTSLGPDGAMPGIDSAFDLGPISVVDVPSTPCVQTNATPVTVMEPEPLFIAYDQAGIVGSRRYAVDGNTLAMMTFGADGTMSSEIASNVLTAKATANERLATLESNGKVLSLHFYDSTSKGIGSAIDLTTGPTGTPVLATGPDSVLALWQADGVLKGRIVTNEGKLGAVVDLGTDSCGDSNCTVRALHNGRDFTIVWSRVLQNERTKTSWAIVGNDGKLTFTKPLLLADGYHRLVDAVLVGTTYAIVFGEGFPTRDAVLVLVDAFGNALGPARRLVGSGAPWGIASTAGLLGVAVGLTDGRAAMRTLTAGGEMVDGWTCLDDSPPDNAFSPQAAIYADKDGFGFVVRMTDGSAASVVTDAHGKGR